ncbi:MAG: threonine-phosphate decarboxylase [Halobacteriales archaeon]
MDPESLDGIGRADHGSSDDPDLLDFSANTNPEVPAGVEDIYADTFEPSRSYPPEPPDAYRREAAEYLDCEPTQVVPTPGGLAAIRLAIQTTVRAGEQVLVPAPSFSEYAREVRIQGAKPVFEPAGDLLAADVTEATLAVVCNPNNPTGEAYDVDALRSFVARCREADTTVLADEAFLGFTEQDSLAGTDGVIVARSLTKLFGLPGLRAGFAVATGRHRGRLLAARRPWNVDTPARAVGTYCMQQHEFIRRTRQRVRSERTRLQSALTNRFEVRASDAPFLLVDVGDRDVAALVRVLEDRGIAVRDATTFRGLESHLRVAVRLPEENDRLLAALSDV